MQLNIIFLIAFALSRLAFAAPMEITDPKDELSRLPGRGSVPFADAFSCEKPYSFFMRTGQCKVHCEFALCEQQCGYNEIVASDFQVEECTKDTATIYSSIGKIFNVTSADYNAASRSLSLTMIKAISNFYDGIEKVQIEDVLFPVPKGLIDNGQMKPLMLTTIVISLFPDKTKPDALVLQLSLDLGRSGLDQLMCVSEDGFCQSNQNYILKRKGLVNAPH